MIRPARVTAQRVDEDQQLHQVVVDRRARGLDQKDVLAAYALVQPDKGIGVSELKDVGATQRQAQIVRDLLRQVPMGRAAVDRQITVELVLGHGWLNNRSSLFSCAFAAPAVGLGSNRDVVGRACRIHDKRVWNRCLCHCRASSLCGTNKSVGSRIVH